MKTDLIELQRQYLAKIYRGDAWFWICKQGRTFDEHDPGSDAKPFPVDKPYLEEACKIWQKYAFTIWEKSRQMMMSWLAIQLHVHLAQFHSFSRVLLSSKDEDDAVKLLDRAWFVYENQDDWLKEMFPAKRIKNSIQFYHKVNRRNQKSSVIEALAQGADEARSMVGSAVLLDEAAFCPHFEGFLQAAIPMSVTGDEAQDSSKPKGGRLTIISTANPGPFQVAATETKKRAVRKEIVLPGLEVWHPQFFNDFAAIRLHYSADPSPKIVAKVAEAKRKYISLGALPAFKKEYEIDYDAMSGERIWPNLCKEVHSLPESWEPPADWVKFRVIDPGWDNACAVNWFTVSEPGWRGCVDRNGNPIPVLVVYRELHLQYHRVDQVYDEIVRLSDGERYTVTLIDPSSDIHRGNEDAGLSIFEKFIDLGIGPLLKANNAVEAGLDEVRLRLAIHGQSPALLIKENLYHTWRECQLYHYKARPLTMDRSREPQPWKMDDHHCDTLRYGCQFRQMPKKKAAAKNPMHSFGWHVEQHARNRTIASLLGNANFQKNI